MLVYQNMDELFDLFLPGQRGEWIAANHGCVCNKDSDPWAPSDWKLEKLRTYWFNLSKLSLTSTNRRISQNYERNSYDAKFWSLYFRTK